MAIHPKKTFHLGLSSCFFSSLAYKAEFRSFVQIEKRSNEEVQTVWSNSPSESWRKVSRPHSVRPMFPVKLVRLSEMKSSLYQDDFDIKLVIL